MRFYIEKMKILKNVMKKIMKMMPDDEKGRKRRKLDKK